MTLIHDFLQFQSWMDRLKAWQMKLQVSFEKRQKNKRDIQFRLERVDESPRIKLRLILLFLIAETTASTGGASARKAKTPWSLLRLVSSAKGKMHFFSVFFFARSLALLSFKEANFNCARDNLLPQSVSK